MDQKHHGCFAQFLCYGQALRGPQAVAFKGLLQVNLATTPAETGGASRYYLFAGSGLQPAPEYFRKKQFGAGKMPAPAINFRTSDCNPLFWCIVKCQK